MARYAFFAAVLVAALAAPMASAAPAAPAKPVVVKATSSLKFVATRVAFRYDSCGCVGR